MLTSHPLPYNGTLKVSKQVTHGVGRGLEHCIYEDPGVSGTFLEHQVRKSQTNKLERYRQSGLQQRSSLPRPGSLATPGTQFRS